MSTESLENSIFINASNESFETLALKVFKFQYQNCTVYRDFCNHLDVKNPTCLEDIPFLPISFFKSHKIVAEGFDPELIFKSSGTTNQIRSTHFIAKPDVYEKSFRKTFEDLMGEIKGNVFLALLPNYIEQGNSSLVYMVGHLIQQSQNELSGFYLNDYKKLLRVMSIAKKRKCKVFLFGVSYALLDLAEKEIDLSDIFIIETGGMKGRRKEMIREELHDILKNGLNVKNIYSEYGMTELLSQAYLQEDGYFRSPNWMKIMIRDVNDALTFLPNGRTGGVNVIDLANLYSCSFIATDDLGVKNMDLFKILGRFDLSDIRGCNLLVN
ncbi:MAG: acyl transferase [Fluviicola sp.]|nr:MAG: acyl transferase [Fluviicola sp.]